MPRKRKRDQFERLIGKPEPTVNYFNGLLTRLFWSVWPIGLLIFVLYLIRG